LTLFYCSNDKHSSDFYPEKCLLSREFDSEPDITCQRWKDFVESRERGFKGYCNTFKVVGPFKFGHEANLSQEKRVKAYKDGGYKIVQFGGRWP